MSYYNALWILSKRKAVPISTVEKELGISNGAIRQWKVTSPTVKNAKKVAAYFGLTLDELDRMAEDND